MERLVRRRRRREVFSATIGSAGCEWNSEAIGSLGRGGNGEPATRSTCSRASCFAAGSFLADAASRAERHWCVARDRVGDRLVGDCRPDCGAAIGENSHVWDALSTDHRTVAAVARMSRLHGSTANPERLRRGTDPAAAVRPHGGRLVATTAPCRLSVAAADERSRVDQPLSRYRHGPEGRGRTVGRWIGGRADDGHRDDIARVLSSVFARL